MGKNANHTLSLGRLYRFTDEADSYVVLALIAYVNSSKYVSRTFTHFQLYSKHFHKRVTAICAKVAGPNKEGLYSFQAGYKISVNQVVSTLDRPGTEFQTSLMAFVDSRKDLKPLRCVIFKMRMYALRICC